MAEFTRLEWRIAEAPFVLIRIQHRSKDVMGADGETIEIFLEDSTEPMIGTINRTANSTGAPRIVGGPAVRDCIVATGNEGQTVVVKVNSPKSIRLHLGGFGGSA